jgi:hypothetical protein
MIWATHQRMGDALRRWSGCAAWVCVLCALTGTSAVCRATGTADRGAVGRPWVTLPLQSLGVPSIPGQFFKFGLSMLTVDFVDDSHLLVTFGTRGLIPRIPGDPPDHDDRMVAAELVELPTGRVVARTEWHMHDHARYLWRLGHGRFLVRTGDSLFALTPLAVDKTEDPLTPITFPQRQGRPVEAFLSPDSSLVTVETAILNKDRDNDGQSQASGNDGPQKPAQVVIDFYRINGGDDPASPFSVTGAGLVRAPGLVLLPMDHDGFLLPGDQKRGRWPVRFNGYGGNVVQVGAVDSTCMPQLQMLSRFQYLALSCQGESDRLKLQVFGMDGHETWEEGFGGFYGQPSFTFAPEAGRFAMSRIISPVESSGLSGLATELPEDATQEVRVYQTESGDLLLKAPCSPVVRNAENFDLSPDGREAAVVNGGAVQVYKLPGPSAQDMKDLKEAASFAPPASDGPVKLSAILVKPADSGASDEGVGSGTPETAGSSAAGASVLPVDADAGSSATKGSGGDAKATDAAETATGAAGAGARDSGAAAGAGGGSSANAGVKAAATDGGASASATATPVLDGTDVSGDAPGAARKPPTLLEPGESAEYKGQGSAPPQ